MSEETSHEIEIDKDSESRDDSSERTITNTRQESDNHDITSGHRVSTAESSDRNSQDENVSLLQSHSATAPNGTLVQCHKHHGSTEQIDAGNSLNKSQEDNVTVNPSIGSEMSKEDSSSSCVT